MTVGSLTLEQFKDELEQRGLPKKGKKTELVARLQGALGNQTKVGTYYLILISLCHWHLFIDTVFWVTHNI